MFAAPGGAAPVYPPLRLLTGAGRAFPADKHTMALAVRLVFPSGSESLADLPSWWPGCIALFEPAISDADSTGWPSLWAP